MASTDIDKGVFNRLMAFEAFRRIDSPWTSPDVLNAARMWLRIFERACQNKDTTPEIAAVQADVAVGFLLAYADKPLPPKPEPETPEPKAKMTITFQVGDEVSAVVDDLAKRLGRSPGSIVDSAVRTLAAIYKEQSSGNLVMIQRKTLDYSGNKPVTVTYDQLVVQF
jgi:hypothetical protein